MYPRVRVLRLDILELEYSTKRIETTWQIPTICLKITSALRLREQFLCLIHVISLRLSKMASFDNVLLTKAYGGRLCKVRLRPFLKNKNTLQIST